MPDTVAFLQLLRQLDSPHAEEQRGSGSGSDSSSTAGAAAAAADGAEAAAEMELPEFRAARGLFRFAVNVSEGRGAAAGESSSLCVRRRCPHASPLTWFTFGCRSSSRATY